MPYNIYAETASTVQMFIYLVDGPMGGEQLQVYPNQTTASINRDGKILTYRKCADGQWRHVPSMDDAVGDE